MSAMVQEASALERLLIMAAKAWISAGASLPPQGGMRVSKIPVVIIVRIAASLNVACLSFVRPGPM